MRHLVLLFTLLLVLACMPAHATVWIVNNNAGQEHDFTTAQAAHDGASDGDTLYVVGSPDFYGNLTSTKQLVWIGPGYRIPENSDTQANPHDADFGTSTWNDGSEGSIIIGLRFQRRVVSLNAQNIVLSRCYAYMSDDDNATLLYVSGDNCIIINNYMIQYDNDTTDRHCLHVSANGVGTIIANNYIHHNYISTSSYWDRWCAIKSETSQVSCYNNVIHGTVVLPNSEFYNNIMKVDTYYYNWSGSYVHHNISAGNDLPNGDGNQENVNMDNVFLNGGSFDGRWQLAAGGPAIGAGANGEDCGMFGGPTPYVLSGIPGIPTISSFFAPSAASPESGLPVEVEIRSRN